MDPEPKRRSRSKAAQSSMVDLEFIQGLITSIDQSGIDSLEITRGGTRIRISKTPAPAPHAPAAAPTHSYPVPQESTGGAPPAAPTSAEGAAAAAPADTQKVDDGVVEIASPMVGTFYRSPSPEAPPYVEVGSQVRKGQTLCILEAMKLMNELEAEVDGVIRGILVENSEPVEYGQALFLIEPTK